MSLLHQTDVYRDLRKTDRKYHGSTLILVLICLAFALVLASAILAPTPGSGVNNESWFVGP
jgi:hypothetical protein